MAISGKSESKIEGVRGSILRQFRLGVFPCALIGGCAHIPPTRCCPPWIPAQPPWAGAQGGWGPTSRPKAEVLENVFFEGGGCHTHLAMYCMPCAKYLVVSCIYFCGMLSIALFSELIFSQNAQDFQRTSIQLPSTFHLATKSALGQNSHFLTQSFHFEILAQKVAIWPD